VGGEAERSIRYEFTEESRFMSASRNATSILLSSVLAFAGVGCAAEVANDAPADETSAPASDGPIETKCFGGFGCDLDDVAHGFAFPFSPFFGGFGGFSPFFGGFSPFFGGFSPFFGGFTSGFGCFGPGFGFGGCI
jgi:hypothetical protein